MRIASLIPSGTDIVAELGLSASLVGVSHACDHPSSRGLPVLTHSIIPADVAPGEIDRLVSEALKADGGGSLYRTERALLKQLAPDIVLSQIVCDVCAVNAATARQDLPPLARLIDLGATSFTGLWADMRAVAVATDADAEPLIASLQARLEAVRGAVAAQNRPRVLALEWTDPPFLGGHWVPEIIEIAGGEHVLGSGGEPSRRATWPEIADSDPDIILLVPCGYGLQETLRQGHALLHQEAFANLRAVKQGKVWATDATHLFSRCTPQSVRTVEVVAGLLHPAVWPAPSPQEAVCLFATN
ncbi:MAG: ABC transporter substrate-binding protein [Abitibacteriaceae bacterium]|nr:ABC transporter substrate-binding protein [Abditibacteriaceae bacterium]